MKRFFILTLLLSLLCAASFAQTIKVTRPLWQLSTVTAATNDTVTVQGMNQPTLMWNTLSSVSEMVQVPDSVVLTYSGIGSATATDSIGVYFYVANAQVTGLFSAFSTIDSIKVQTVSGAHKLVNTLFVYSTQLKVCRKGQSTAANKNAYIGSTLKEANLEFYYHR
jgi:hypothetical protein